MSLQKKIMEKLHIQPVINAQEELQKRINFLKKYLLQARSKGFVLGISGGQDSTLAGRLAQLAAEELTI